MVVDPFTAKGKNVYNITYMTAHELAPKFSGEYNRILNSMQILK